MSDDRRAGGAGDWLLLALAVIVGLLALGGGLDAMYTAALDWLRYGPVTAATNAAAAAKKRKGKGGGSGGTPAPSSVTSAAAQAGVAAAQAAAAAKQASGGSESEPVPPDIPVPEVVPTFG